MQSQGGVKGPHCCHDAAYAAAIDMGCAEGSKGATVPEVGQGRRRKIYRVYGIEFCVSQRERDWAEGKCRLVCSEAAASAAAAVEVSAYATAGNPTNQFLGARLPRVFGAKRWTSAEGISAAEGSARVSGWSLWCPCDGFEPDTSNAAR